ncbi:FadR/GntR family transcriptional regulator [Amycolatopsis sp. NPDC051903]|uniref:FadR/GntR family transcriptional regulator n=1 Tax=Amycolatopsis sp. NPDC051903 TaxID=3363936 RepID=UPI0037AF7487
MGQPDNVRYLGSPGQVLAGIQDWILTAHLRAGDPLPAERELARALGVGSGRLREGVRALEAAGVLEPAADATAAAVVAEAPADALHKLLRLHLSLSRFGTGDLMSIRIELERSSATRAARSALPDDLTPLREITGEMGRPGVTRGQFRELDSAFHLGLARAASNDLAAVLLASLGDAVGDEMTAGYARTADWPATARQLADEHTWILDAIETGDPDRAAAEVTRHIAGFYGLRAG